MGAPTLVQSKIGLGGGNQSIANSFTTLPAVGSVIVVAQTSGGANTTGDTCTDNQGGVHTYTKRVTQTGISFWTTVVTASSGTFTITTFGNNSSANANCIMEWSGCDTSAVIDGTPGTATNSGFTNTSLSCSAGSASQVADTILLLHVTGSSGQTPVYSGAMSQVASDTTGGVNSVISVGQGTVSATGAQTGSVSWGSVDSYDAVAMLLKGAGPTISSQPSDTIVNTGNTATFSVTASGTGTLTYQWKLNGSNISGATSSSYTTGTLTISDTGGLYSVDVTDSNGTTTSRSALLTVTTWQLTGTGLASREAWGVGAWATGAGLNAEAYTAGAGGSHSTTGSLAASSAALSGTATHLTLHATSGSLSAGSATISGTATHQHVATGALSASAATISGTAAHFTLHTSSGALSAGSAMIAGTAAHEHAASGTLTAAAATLSGTATHSAASPGHSATGALAADVATLSGTATHLTLHATTGALVAGSATLNGSAVHPHVTSGALTGQAATLTGTAAHEHAAAGALIADAATVAGTAVHTAVGSHVTSGTLAADAATLSGVALRVAGMQVLGGWAKFRKRHEPDEEEPPEVAPQPIPEPPKPTKPPIERARIVGRITVQPTSLEAFARKKRQQKEDEELLLF